MSEPLLPGNGSSEPCTHAKHSESAACPGTTSELATTVNYVTAGLGVGILSLPWSAAGASVLPGAVVTGLVIAVMAETCVIIVEAGERHQTFDLGALLGLIPGRLGWITQVLCNLVIWVATLGCLIGLLIVIVDSAGPMMPEGPLRSRWVIVILTSAVCLPLCFLAQERLAFTSTLAIAVNVYLLAFVAYLSISDPWDGEPSCTMGFGKGVVSLSSTLTFALAPQMFILPMYEVLEKRTVASARRVIWRGSAALFVLFVGFQTLALRAFGPNIPQDIFTTLPHGSAGVVARLGMIGIVLGCYPLNVIPMVAPVRNAKSGGRATANLFTLAIALSAMSAALVFDQLGVINIISGAASVAIVDAYAPALIGLYLLDSRSPRAMYALAAVGTVMTVLGFAMPSNYVDEVQSACLY